MSAQEHGTCKQIPTWKRGERRPGGHSKQRIGRVREARLNDDSHHRAIPVPGRGEHGATTLPELRVLERRVFRDPRGSFAELWRDDAGKAVGLPRFVQDNVATSRRGVIRGLHFQNPHPQAKLVSVPLGEIFDVAVDVRVGSPTFGRWATFTLSDTNGRYLYIPRGFAHGYQTLSETSVVIYKCSDYYSPSDERGIRWSDAGIGIPWPIDDATVSERDASAPILRNLLDEWLPHIEP